MSNQQALLTKAKNADITSLKSEIVQGRTGVDLAQYSVMIEKQEEEMPKITIDEIECHTEDLTENGRAQLASLQFLEGQMQRIG